MRTRFRILASMSFSTACATTHKLSNKSSIYSKLVDPSTQSPFELHGCLADTIMQNEPGLV